MIQPDVRIIDASLSSGILINAKSRVTVKNYGEYAVRDVRLIAAPAYAADVELKIRELNPNEEYVFVFDLFPSAYVCDVRQKYERTIKNFAGQTRSLTVRLNLEFTWNQQIIRVKEYSMVVMSENGKVAARLA